MDQGRCPLHTHTHTHTHTYTHTLDISVQSRKRERGWFEYRRGGLDLKGGKFVVKNKLDKRKWKEKLKWVSGCVWVLVQFLTPFPKRARASMYVSSRRPSVNITDGSSCWAQWGRSCITKMGSAEDFLSCSFVLFWCRFWRTACWAGSTVEYWWVLSAAQGLDRKNWQKWTLMHIQLVHMLHKCCFMSLF